MKRALACLSLAIPLVACRLDRLPPQPAPDKDHPLSQGKPGDGSGGQFFCRTDDGQTCALALRELAVRLTTRPGTVRSHLTMEIAGPANERVEAVMRLAVPRGAAVTGAILWVNGRPMDGVFVQRDRARQIYRAIVERRRDPALVTWDGPGWVSVSIFPLERGQPRRFELEWIEPAAVEAGVVKYRVPDIVNAGHVVGRPSLVVDGRPMRIDDHAVVALAPAGASQVLASRAPGDPFHHLLAPSAGTEGTPRVVIVAETSFAMPAGDRIRQRAAIDAVLGELPPTSKVTLLAADWDVSVVADGIAPAGIRQALEKLDRIPSAGALHLERALTAAATRATEDEGTTVLFVGRGMDGFGGDAVHAPLGTLRGAGTRLSVVAMNDIPGALADAAALTGGEALPVVTLRDDLGTLVGALRARPSPPALVARGLDWRALETATGQTVWVGRALELPSSPEPNGAVDIVRADPAELLPLWDRASLAWSEHSGPTGADRSTTTALTPLRALLVLEREQDYPRFGLAAPQGPLPGSASAAESLAYGNDAAGVPGYLGDIQGKDSAALGGPGIVGTGSAAGTIGIGSLAAMKALSDHGAGYGREEGGLGGRRARAPDVIPGPATVRGPLDKEVIRRVVRRHINEVRYCYEQARAKPPTQGGRVVVQFTIAAMGQVLTPALQSTTLGDGRVEACVVQAVRRWEFPRPLGADFAVVSFPFVFTPVGGAAVAPAPSPAPVPPLPAELLAAPALSTWEPLLALSGEDELANRVQRVAALLGLDRTSDPESLAWTIDRHRPGGREIVLVARLLVAAHRDRDAIRVLSEWGNELPIATAEELRRMGADADAAEVLALARRGR